MQPKFPLQKWLAAVDPDSPDFDDPAFLVTMCKLAAPWKWYNAMLQLCRYTSLSFVLIWFTHCPRSQATEQLLGTTLAWSDYVLHFLSLAPTTSRPTSTKLQRICLCPQKTHWLSPFPQCHHRFLASHVVQNGWACLFLFRPYGS